MTVRNVHFPTLLLALSGVMITLMLSIPVDLYGQSLNEIPIGDHFAIKHWNSQDGLPQNSVNAIVQTHDGYIWVGTYGGTGSV